MSTATATHKRKATDAEDDAFCAKRKAADAEDDEFFAVHADAVAAAVRAAEAAYKARRLSATTLRVISGGQTGADRAALEAARNVRVPTGGTAPCGFMTASGRDYTLRSVFGLCELPIAQRNRVSVSQMHVLRSQRNVDNADVTVAFRLKASVGTDKTIGYAITRKWRVPSARDLQRSELEQYKPCLVVRSVDDVEAAAQTIAAFVQRTGAHTINVCGHRSDETADVLGFSVFVRHIVEQALDILLQNK